MRTIRLFVYGTLQPHAGTRMGQWLAARLERAEAARIPGRIGAVKAGNGKAGNGWFPALVPGRSAARVHGTLCRLRLRPGDLALLDRYEGREYRRVAIPVRTARGHRACAQVYLWRLPLPPGAPAIPGGNYLAWLERTGRRPFTTLRNGA